MSTSSPIRLWIVYNVEAVMGYPKDSKVGSISTFENSTFENWNPIYVRPHSKGYSTLHLDMIMVLGIE